MVSKPFEIQPRFPLIEVKKLDLFALEKFTSLFNLNAFNFSKSRNKLMKNSLIFQAQIQNITNTTVYMEDVQLQPLNDSVVIENVHSAISSNEK